MRRLLLLQVFMFWASGASAHGIAGPGLLHPLTGLDHMLTMVAVGAWSAQLGGRAVWAVPLAFVLTMALGGAIGAAGITLPWAEPAILASAVLVGLAIAFDRAFVVPVAAAATGIFGFVHGFAHGAEFPTLPNAATYIASILVTTAGLHVLGLSGSFLILETSAGRTRLRIAGLGVVGLAFGLFFSSAWP